MAESEAALSTSPSCPRRSPRLNMLRQLLSSSSETPKHRRSPRLASRRLVNSADSVPSPSILGKRQGAALSPSSAKRSKDFNISAATKSAVLKLSDHLNFTWYRDVASDVVLVVTSKTIHPCPCVGDFSRIRLVLRSTGTYCIQVLLKAVEEGTVFSSDDFFNLCEKIINPNMKFCPGITEEEYTQYRDVLRYDQKSVQISEKPFSRICSVHCKLWFPIARSCSKAQKQASEVTCVECVRLKVYLKNSADRIAAASPGRKVQHQQSSSHYPLKYLSPDSKKVREMNKKSEQAKQKRLIKKYVPDEIELDDDQHDEMCRIHSAVEDHAKEDLQQVLKEVPDQTTRDTFLQAWENDSRKKFATDQMKNEAGNKGNRWSAVTIRMALAVYIRSPAAYRALQSFGLIQLPSKSTMQAYTGAFLTGPGACEEAVAKQARMYTAFKEDMRIQGKPEPKGDGVLIFDEVKVVARLMWNSRSQKIIGLAMSPEEMASLHDIYFTSAANERTQQTTYIMQFLWRDLTSSFDLVGPYYDSAGSMKSKFVLACVYETLRLLHLYGFKVSVLMCDGASSNLTALKTTTGVSGAYAADKDNYKIPSPSFENPYDPPNRIYWMICPSHQLKNMINALFSSRENGTKDFECNDIHFGWDDIKLMYARECKRMQSGLARTVPKLRETHIIRDSWTKLNVAPAKIMQQEQVLSELRSYSRDVPDAKSTVCTLEYLQACNHLFEKGFLSSKQVSSTNREVICSIEKGFGFFKKWLEGIHQKYPQFNSTSPKQRKFLSWQTWDLLRIDVQGFMEFCDTFLKQYPGYFVCPIRLTGSAVESLFAQYKYTTGGKLDAANYSVARAAFLTKQAIVNHHSGKGYRDMPLCIHPIPLEKKKYGERKKNSDNN